MKKVKVIILFIIFNILLASTFLYLNYVFRNKEYEGAQDLFSAYESPNPDIVFIGNSHQFCSINPDLLYDEYKVDSFMLATSAQTVPMSYYAAMEAIELKKPKTIVFEASYVANDFRTLDGMDHCFFDGFPRCKARKLALEDLVSKDERIYYLFPFGMFHSRWKDLEKSDFEGFPLSKRGGFVTDEVFSTWGIPVIPKDQVQQMPKEMEKYLLNLIDLCDREGVELIIYIAPFNGLYFDDGSYYDLVERQRIFNSLYDICQKKNVKFYNLFYEIDNIGLDDETDWMDSQHFNKNGQAKFTRYMADKGYLGELVK